MGAPLRILHVGPLPPPAGGIATVVASLSRELASSCDVRVLNNVKTTCEGRSLQVGIVAQVRLLAHLAWLCVLWRPHIVHVHTCSWFSFWRSSADVVVARLLGRRVVLHIHGGRFKDFLESLSPFRAYLARLVLGACSCVIVLGRRWKEVLGQWCDPAKVVIVSNGVQVEEQQVLREAGDFTVLCLGNYCREKGQADLLRAVAAIRGERTVRVVLLGGEGSPGQRQQLQQLAMELGLGDQVEIPGPKFGSQLDEYWRQADCYCLPSYAEALPMSILEAMARGLPVVATSVGAIPEMAEDGCEALLCKPGDVRSVAMCLQRLIDSPPLASCIGRAGRERVIGEFTLASSACNLLTVYQHLSRRAMQLAVEVPEGQSTGECP